VDNEVEIFLVEDNIYDAELAMRAVRKSNLVKNLFRVCDGEQTLHYFFVGGQYKFIDYISNPGSSRILLNQQPEIKNLIK
jgi:hypothetical protein